jgi:hypothetical protein
MNSITLAFFGLLLISDTHPSPALCRTGAAGVWKVSDVRLDTISAVTAAEARKSVGEIVKVTPNRIIFPPDTCDIKGTENSDSRDYPGFPLEIHVICKGKTSIPELYIGHSCAKIVAALDGANYVLKRVRAAPSVP